MRVLLADDHGIVRRGLRSLLEEAGLSVVAEAADGLDAVRLANGNWLLIYNDTTKGRASLAVSLSDDEGKTWKWTRHLEKHPAGSYHYPALVQGKDGTVHVVYSYFVAGGKSMKHAAFNEAWVKQGGAPLQNREKPVQ